MGVMRRVRVGCTNVCGRIWESGDRGRRGCDRRRGGGQSQRLVLVFTRVLVPALRRRSIGSRGRRIGRDGGHMWFVGKRRRGLIRHIFHRRLSRTSRFLRRRLHYSLNLRIVVSRIELILGLFHSRVRRVGILAGFERLCYPQRMVLGELDLGCDFGFRGVPDLQELEEGSCRLKRIGRLSVVDTVSRSARWSPGENQRKPTSSLCLPAWLPPHDQRPPEQTAPRRRLRPLHQSPCHYRGFHA